jgi:hypothetical protein
MGKHSDGVIQPRKLFHSSDGSSLSFEFMPICVRSTPYGITNSLVSFDSSYAYAFWRYKQCNDVLQKKRALTVGAKAYDASHNQAHYSEMQLQIAPPQIVHSRRAFCHKTICYEATPCCACQRL